MATIRPLCALLLLPGLALAASTPEERALILNEEMDFLLRTAPQPRLYARPGTPPSGAPRSGPSPSQVAGVENIEERFFKDEVSFQAAAPTTRVEMRDDDEMFDADAISPPPVDGSVPKTR